MPDHRSCCHRVETSSIRRLGCNIGSGLERVDFRSCLPSVRGYMQGPMLVKPRDLVRGQVLLAVMSQPYSFNATQDLKLSMGRL